MIIEPLGDLALILRDLSVEPYRVAKALNEDRPAGLIEAVASYETVGLYIDPATFDEACLDPLPVAPEGVGRRHLIPVCYELGEDLDRAAQKLDLSSDQLIAAHSGEDYRCFAVGFCPGFAFLGYLPGALAGLPRLEVPRIRVTPGSVGITGRQTGVYPLERPGGWWLIGRTPLTLVDEDFFPIEAGDTVRFAPIGREEYEARKGERL